MGRSIRGSTTVIAACCTAALLAGIAADAGANPAQTRAWSPAGVVHGSATMRSFGSATAISADGTLALVGTSGESTRGVAVLSNASGQWRPVAVLRAIGGRRSDRFGTAVALDAAGTAAIVGAPSAHDDHSGAAYLFTDVGGVWQQTAELTGTPSYVDGAFGTSVALSADGTVALVGSLANPDRNRVPPGAAYAFTLKAGSWSQVQMFEPPISGRHEFGRAVAMSADSAVLMVGAPVDTRSRTSRVCAYLRGRDGSWTLDATLRYAGETNKPAFGSALALSADGRTALVGAPNAGGHAGGAVFAYGFDGGRWRVAHKFGAGPLRTPALFGSALALSADGTVGLVGAPSTYWPGDAVVIDGIGSGHAARTNLTSPRLRDGDHFGAAVALSADGTTALVGAPNHAVRPQHPRYLGAAFLYTASGR